MLKHFKEVLLILAIMLSALNAYMNLMLVTTIGKEFDSIKTENIRQDSVIQSQALLIDSLNTIHPKPKYRSSKWICPQTFYGFALWGRVNTNGVSEDLVEALENFNGPKVKITSLRRNWRSNPQSQHNHGRAVDLEFDHALIMWLVSEQGQSWLSSHGLKLLIEDKPNSKKLLPYKELESTSPFVFENPDATGAHIHLNLT